GLSGVVYALMGYVWLRGERDPQSGIYLQRGLIIFALLWIVAGLEELQKMWILRKIIHPMGEIDAMEFLINKLAMTKTNDDFFEMM
ncbi:hypothetical protein ONK27_26390, partial [Salmonella enterica subsp. enterica serovar Virginia]|nr:hypothetical protein [Salmonella enterica subsp. enterica serovar Virginia]